MTDMTACIGMTAVMLVTHAPPLANAVMLIVHDPPVATCGPENAFSHFSHARPPLLTSLPAAR